MTAPTPDEADTHARWLFELRSVVSTAGVATTLGRSLLGQDAATAVEVLREAELAFRRCRELLDAGDAHVRADAAAPPLPATRPASGRRRAARRAGPAAVG